jgi:hypothetical protein
MSSLKTSVEQLVQRLVAEAQQRIEAAQNATLVISVDGVELPVARIESRERIGGGFELVAIADLSTGELAAASPKPMNGGSFPEPFPSAGIAAECDPAKAVADYIEEEIAAGRGAGANETSAAAPVAETTAGV